MNTRYKKEDGPLSQNRYMSSVEFSELRGISGVAVSTRAAILLQQPKSELIWFIQALSLTEGGLRRVAKELVEMFPDRIGTPEMHKAGVRPGKTAPAGLGERVHEQLTGHYRMPDADGQRPAKTEKGEVLLELCRHFALTRCQSEDDYGARRRAPCLEEFLIDLCINPRLSFSLPGGKMDFSELESDLAVEKHPGLEKSEIKSAALIYFADIIGVLAEYKRRRETKICESFQLTAIGKKVWETLDYALASRGMVVLDGLEGRGKTEATKAWCEMHLGAARFVSLKGVSNKTTAFREIAKALGIASSYTRKATEMQARIEDVLKLSKLMLVVDEAHFLFNQSRRMFSRPELIDWIDTAICNHGIGCALVTTPQFIVCMTRAADQVEWNYRQFRRRVKRWIKLPATNTDEDITAVARSVFKNANEAAIKKIVGYALLSKRDLSAVGDVAREIQAMRGVEDLDGVSVEQVQKAIYEFLLPSDKAFLEGMEGARTMARRAGRPPASPPATSESLHDEEPLEAIEPRARRPETLQAGNRIHDAILTGH